MTVASVCVFLSVCTCVYSSSMAPGQSYATATRTVGWCPRSQVNPGVGSLLWNKWCQAYEFLEFVPADASP